MPGRTTWFIRIDDRTVGPVSGSDLRRAAQSGRLNPDDRISQDGTKWYRARQVKGLVFGDGATGDADSGPRTGNSQTATSSDRHPPRDTANNTARNRETSAAKSASDASQRNTGEDQFPLIRVRYISDVFERGIRALLHGYEISAVFSDEMASGRRIRRPVLEEHDCTSVGASNIISGCHRVKRVAFSDVTKGEFVGQLRINWRGVVVPVRTVTLELKAAGRKRKFTLAAREVPNVYHALRQRLGERLEPVVRWRGPRLALPLLLLLLSLPFALAAVSFTIITWQSLGKNPIGASLGALAGGSGVAVAGLLIAYAAKCFWTDFFPKQLPFEALAAPEWPPRSNRMTRLRQPFRSARAGWALKLLGAIWFGVVVWQIPRLGAAITAADQAGEYQGSQIVALAFTLLSFPTLICLYLGHGLAQRGLETGLKDDQRRPLLYLRSFSVDGRTTLQPDSILAAWLGISGAGSMRSLLTSQIGWLQWKLFQAVHPLRLVRLFFGVTADTAEQSIVGYFHHLGPIVAIGKPGERVSQVGAHREYVADDVWKNVVLERLRVAQAVVIQPAQSAGMAWELSAVFSHCPFERILIVFSQAHLFANEYEDLRAQLVPLVRGTLPRCLPYRGRPAFLWFERDGSPRWTEISYKSPATWLFTGNAVDLEHSLRPFIEGIHGGEREGPRPARKFTWPHYAAAWALAFCLMFVLGTWLKGGHQVLGLATPVGSAQLASPPRILAGKIIPYRLIVPSSWQPRIPDNELTEHELARPGVGLVKVVAHRGEEDLSTLAEQVVANEQSKLGDKGVVTAQSFEKTTISKRPCVRGRLRINMRDGATIYETVIGYSGSDGTVLLDIAGVPGISPELQNEIDGIVASFIFPEPSVPVISPELLARLAKPVVPKLPEVPPHQVVRGIVIPYSLDVPTSWETQPSEQAMVEHAFAKSGVGALRLMAQKEKTDLKTFADDFLRGARAKLDNADSVNLDSQQAMSIDGHDCLKLTFTLKRGNGATVSQIVIVYSGDDGTIIVVGVAAPGQRAEVESILGTLHIGRSAK